MDEWEQVNREDGERLSCIGDKKNGEEIEINHNQSGPVR